LTLKSKAKGEKRNQKKDKYIKTFKIQKNLILVLIERYSVVLRHANHYSLNLSNLYLQKPSSKQSPDKAKG